MRSEKSANKGKTRILRAAAFCLAAVLAAVPAYAAAETRSVEVFSAADTEEAGGSGGFLALTEAIGPQNGAGAAEESEEQAESGFRNLFGGSAEDTDSDGGAGSSADYRAAVPGEIVRFGSWEQDADAADGPEEIEWLVLAKTPYRVLLITRYAIDCRPFHTGESPADWESCSLRTWLNGDFFGSAFSEEEKAAIAAVTVSADRNPEYDTDPGNDTKDSVFLLSVSEVEEYVGEGNPFECGATEFTAARGAFTSPDRVMDGQPSCWWWLRTPGENGGSAACVNALGKIDYMGFEGSYDLTGVRPAIWLDLAS